MGGRLSQGGPRSTTLEWAAERLGRAFAALSGIGEDIKLLEAGLGALGWAPPPSVDLTAIFTLDASNVTAKLRVVLESTDDERSDAVLMASRYGDLILAVDAFAEQIIAFSQELPSALEAAGDYAQKSRIADELPRRVIDLIIVAGTSAASPLTALALRLLGVFREEQHDADPNIYQVQHSRAIVDFQQLTAVLSDPMAAVGSEYAWGTSAFDAARLLENIGLVLQGVGARGLVSDMAERVEARIGNAPTVIDDGPTPQLLLELMRAVGAVYAEAGVSVHRLRATRADGHDAGIEIAPYVRGSAPLRIPLSGSLTLTIETDIDIANGIGIAIRPTGVELRGGLLTTGAPTGVSGGLGVSVEMANESGVPRQLLAAEGGTAVTFDSAYIQAGGRVTGDERPDAYLRGGLVGCRLAVTTAKADGFLQQVLPDGLAVGFDIRARWSKLNGLAFEGSGGLDANIPVHATVGPITIDSVRLSLVTRDGEIEIMAAASGKLALGPVIASPTNIGIRGRLSLSPGNLGPLDLDLQFKPPSGLGLMIDAGAVVGGGYLFFDDLNQEYAGALELEFGGIGLNAIGLLNTKMPDGSPIQMPDGTPGFSLLVIITAEFNPIQLGFGFALSAVGGVVGVNRTVAIEAVRAGIKNRTLESILFPKDPVTNAAQIVSNLGAVFPLALGRYAFGPMARLNWGGAVSILTLDVGLVLELPAPMRLAVIGRLRMVLPHEEAAIVAINMDVLGAIDFGRGDVSVDAALYDSTIAGFALTGEMAMRANWLEHPGFALSVGGFNPRFQPPPGFPALGRLALSLTTGENPRLRLECYLALTSNTAQVGARLELYAEALGLSIAGFLYFDALFQFEPFGFIADMGGGVALRAGDRNIMMIAVYLTLSGPQPWHACGRATFEILFFKISVSFDVRFGADEPAALPEPVDVGAKLQEALADARNWSAQLPPEGQSLVSLRKLARSDGDVEREIIAHPLGALSFSQRVAPLGIEIHRYGSASILEERRFEITSVSIGDEAASLSSPIKEEFAPAQFFDLTDDEKLSRPSFEPMEAGRRVVVPGLGRDRLQITAVVLEYEEIEVDTPAPAETSWAAERTPFPASVAGAPRMRRARGRPLDGESLALLVETGPAAMAKTRTTGEARYRGPRLGLGVRTTAYSVIGATLEGVPGGSARGEREAVLGRADTYIEAIDQLRWHAEQHPAEQKTMRVVPATGVSR